MPKCFRLFHARASLTIIAKVTNEKVQLSTLAFIMKSEWKRGWDMQILYCLSSSFFQYFISYRMNSE
jgi:hypothetical protein